VLDMLSAFSREGVIIQAGSAREGENGVKVRTKGNLPTLPARLPPPAPALAAGAAAGRSGLPLLLPCGVPFLLVMFNFSFWRFRAPSLMSPPEPAPPSVSLPEPPPRGRLTGRPDVLRERVGWGAEDGGARGGEPGREGGCRVLFAWAWGCDDDVRGCFFFCFLREDSLPLASELRGDPGRLRLFMDEEILSGLSCFLEGVLVPFVEASDTTFGLDAFSFSGVDLSSSAFLRSSSLSRSVSVSSDSL